MIVSQNLLPSNHTAHLGSAAVPRGIQSSISKHCIVVKATESAKWKINSNIVTMNPIAIAGGRLGYRIYAIQGDTIAIAMTENVRLLQLLAWLT